MENSMMLTMNSIRKHLLCRESPRHRGTWGFWGLCVGMAWNCWAPLWATARPPPALHLRDTPQASRLLGLKGLMMLKGPDQTALVSCGAAAAVSQGTPLQWLSCESLPAQHSLALEIENGRSLCPQSGKCSWLKFFSFFFFAFGRLTPFCKEDELGLEEIRCVYLVCNIFVLQIATF